VTDLYRSLGFLKLDDIYKLVINKFMYQLHYKKLPYVFYNKFIKNCTVYTHNTRLNKLMTYHIPRVNKTYTKKTNLIQRSQTLERSRRQIQKHALVCFQKTIQKLFI